MVTIKKSTLWKITFVAAIIIVILIIWNPFRSSPTGGVVLEGSSFSDTGDNIITDADGKPYVILFSTTWCSHCKWIKSTFDELIQEDYANQVNIQHWELDTKDNTLTSEIETEIPKEIMDMYEKYNPEGSIPTFVFGGKYMRIGTGYERQNDLNAELEDFKLIINKLLE
ncbi:MAG: thioredoxin family protein [Nanoarchaeota archaeon]